MLKFSLAMAGLQLPARYHKMEIRQLQSHVRFDEFDFSFYNRTKFSGLENSMANCYCNPLMQVNLANSLIDAIAHRRPSMRRPMPSVSRCCTSFQ